MTPESKAMQLTEKFAFHLDDFQTKQCALICVYEIMETLIELNQDISYWQQVRMHLVYMGTGELEAKSDRFNLNA